MTELQRKEDVASRIRRVAAETGPLGLMIRGASRAMFAASEFLDGAGCSLLTSIPPALMTRSRDRRLLQRNKELGGRHRGKRCFILGNGPSLRDEDLSLLNGEMLITVNQGHLFARANGLTPAYHACVDSYYLDPAHDGILRDWATFQKESGATFLLSVELADRFEQLGITIDRYAIKQFLKSTYFDRIDQLVPVDLVLVQPGYLSVIHFAIVAAIYMEFSEICLLGCDMDFFVNPDAAFTHSYDSDGADSLATATELFGWDQVELIAWCLDEFRAFRQLGRLAEANGSRVINAGRNGALNVFSRETLQSVQTKQVGELA